MATKLTKIAELYAQTMRSLSGSMESWMSFLQTAAHMYKYPFHAQILIHAQRPDATACASFDLWNNRMKRYINRGATGIALLDDSGQRPMLRYVFDVSDTNTRSSVPFQLWQMHEADQPVVLEELANHFGAADGTSDLPFEQQLFIIVSNAIADNISDYTAMLYEAAPGSSLEELDKSGVELILTAMLEYSVTYICMARAGLDVDAFSQEYGMEYPISIFDTPAVLSCLGQAASDISEMVLRQMERSVRENQRTEREIFAKEQPIEENEEKSIERGAEYEQPHDDTDRRLQDTGIDIEPAAGDGDQQIWADAKTLLEGAETGAVQPHAADGNALSAPVGDRPNDERTGAADHSADGVGRGRDGSTETERPDGMGAADEQHQAARRGTGDSGVNLQLELFPTEAEQIQGIEEAEAKGASAFSISQEDIDRSLVSGTAFHNGKLRVFLHFSENPNNAESAAFLKKEYGIGGRSFTYAGGSGGFLDWDTKGYQFASRGFQQKQRLSWTAIAKRIRELIAAERYLSDAEISELPAYRQELEGGAQAQQQREDERQAAAAQERTDKAYRFAQGDMVHIGWQEHIILSLGRDTVTLSDPKFPLLSEDMPRVEFERKVRENPRNDHLIVEKPEVSSEVEGYTGPFVIIAGSESNRFGDGERLTFMEADAKFRAVERLERQERIEQGRTGGYNKTWGKVYYLYDPADTELSSYEFRYDICDYDEQHSGLYNHIKNFWAYAEEQLEKGVFSEYTKEDVATIQPFLSIIQEHRDLTPPPTPAEEKEPPDITGMEAVIAGSRYRIDGVDGDKAILRSIERTHRNGDPVIRIADTAAATSIFMEQAQAPEMPAEETHTPEIIIGAELTIKDRKYIVDSINGGNVSLRDITFQGAVGFPIFREENLAFVRQFLEPVRAAQPAPQPGPVIEAPEPAKPVNFRITDDALGHGGQKTKYGYNIAAIRTLQQIESEHRHATSEEQETLSRYVGWGGIPQAFDEHNDKWVNEYAELKSLLSEKEYETARSTTLNAHYTSPIVIKAMYETLSRMGFETGNVLEPALGIGNFFGLLPESMRKSKLYGAEIDSVTGRIAQRLYPNARIAVQGYEDTNLPDSFFDVAIGNVPFGSYGIADKRYDKNKFHIHDYFFAKTLDKVRPGGVIAFITSKGTMDKKNPEVRKYIAQRADLLGAVRLPNNAFLANAGTEVTTDILFLQKRDAPIEVEPGWVHLAQTADGIPINAYYAAHPEMVLGRMAFDRSMYGNEKETACIPIEGAADLKQQLQEALAHIEGTIPAYAHEQELDEDTPNTIPADPDVRNFSYTLVDGKIYYRENSIMRPVETSITGANRIRGMVELRDCVRRLIDMQLADYPDADIAQEQQRLNTLYDAYTAKYGMLNSRGNEMAFSEDSGYFLLCSLEILDDEQNFKCKADMFTKRTIRPQMVITSAENAGEALAASLSERGKVDMPYMMELSGLSEDAIMEQLHGVLFQDLQDGGSFIYRTSDEFLSGNVREKLRRYEHLLSIAPGDYEHLSLLQTNVDALKNVQPKDLSASEIDVRLGATWLPAEDIKQFMDELLSPDAFDSERTQVHYSAISGNWNIANKASGRGNVKVQRTYGTSRINAYHILENTLNLRDVRVFDTVWEDGKEKRVLNAKETMIAQQRQQAIKDAFQNWIWADPQRRERLARLYNDTFNCIRQREYDGSHLTFPGMNPEIKLNPHQVNAIARGIYGGNELLAHCVGAGKTFTMAALAMKCKQIGLTHKSMIVVPNHIIGQFAGEFLQLYPSANILVANKKDFEPARRKKFCARIATGDYDAVIIGHSQFEKIPVSMERRQAFLENQIDELMQAIREAKAEKAENFTIKQMEGMRKSLEVKLKRLNDTTRKDNVIDFEMLGVDRLFVDEADNYKNLFLQTKMRNVAGIAQTEAQKSSDMYMKSQYINEITDYRGMVFATGTPISNSMVELYTMQRYLQPQTLRFHGLHHFDSWAATFGERVTALEIAPEGTGYRLKTRFAKFFNLPELMSMFRLVADIQTKDLLNLPTPKVNYHTIALKPSEIQQEMIKSLAERAEKVRKGTVDPREDNMLAITNDGRKLALDQRLANPLLPDDESSKANECAEQVFATWERTKDERYTQLIFCDLSTPKKDGSFNVYDDIREKLIAKGVPPEEIAFIHSANTDERKIRLFSHVRAGNVRILMGSTAKMGAGTNVQRLLKAEHHLDCPWRPRDVEQREGRIERQGNENDEVDIYRYVKEGSFDSFLWQTVETKQKFISQVMTGRTPVRSCEDMDEAVLNYAEVKALAAGDPDIKERMQLDTDIKRLKLLQSNYLSNKYELEDMVNKHYPARIAQLSSNNEAIRKDIALYEQHKSDDFPGMEICGMPFAEKAKAGAALLETCKAQTELKPHPIGKYCGFTLLLSFNPTFKKYALYLESSHRYELELGSDIHGNIQRMDNCLKGMPETALRNEQTIAEIQRQMENAASEIAKPFAQEFDLAQKQARLIELDAKLKIGEHINEAAVMDEPEEHMKREEIVMER